MSGEYTAEAAGSPLTIEELLTRVNALEAELADAQAELARKEAMMQSWRASAQARIARDKAKAEAQIANIRKNAEERIASAKASASRKKPASEEDEEESSVDVNAIMQAIAEIDSKVDSTPKERAKQKAEAMLIAIPPVAFLKGLKKRIEAGDAKAMGLYMQALGLMTKEAQEGDTTPLAPIFNLHILSGGQVQPDAPMTFDVHPEPAPLRIAK